jgi:methionyl-tRNA formyltransferase
MNVIAISNDLYNQTDLLKKQNIFVLNKKEYLTYQNLIKYNPDYVFFPHWSYIIPKEIFENFNCIIFHMTDLPFGRGGSPLQNLLERKICKTKISAMKCTNILDGGDIYLKRDFDISYGNAEEIYLRGAVIISEMIDEIITTNPQPIPQNGEVVEFERRSPEQSDISGFGDLEMIFNYIRMLDAPGYPHAYIKQNVLKYEFHDVKWMDENTLCAQVKVTQDKL